jgi:hypothetical protein
MSTEQIAMQQDRGRVALSLMANAGYDDPWQAPEAWRLAAAKKLPANLDSFKYPDLSSDQLSVLDLPYKPETANQSAGAAALDSFVSVAGRSFRDSSGHRLAQ